MPRVWISVGSNIERETHIRAALDDLRARFGELIVSPVYETPAVGFAGEPFLNLVVGVDSERPPAELHELMRELDVLTYGDAVTDDGGKALPRDEILEYAFVLAPLADVAGAELHPQRRETYAALWRQMAARGGAELHRLTDTAWLRD